MAVLGPRAGLPLLVAEGDGNLREPFARIGAVRIEAPTWRRRRRTAIARRRPSLLAAPPGWQIAGNAARASRRARDHRKKLNPPPRSGEGDRPAQQGGGGGAGLDATQELLFHVDLRDFPVTATKL